jgi:hypothetical protein
MLSRCGGERSNSVITGAVTRCVRRMEPAHCGVARIDIRIVQLRHEHGNSIIAARCTTGYHGEPASSPVAD